MSVRDILQAAAGLGGEETYAISSTGTNVDGVLGRNLAFNLNTSSPVQIGALDNWVFIKGSTTYATAFAINDSGDLYGWGKNSPWSTLGDETLINRSSPVQVGVGKTWAGVFPCASINTECVFAITDGGQLWAWGENANGQLGINDGAVNSRSSPVQVGSLTNWKMVDGRSQTILATKTDGTLWWWGFNVAGSAGTGIGPPFSELVSSPVQVGALSNWDSVSSNRTTAAVKTDGTLWAWGENSFGACGLGNTIARSSPVQVGSLTNWKKVVVGSNQGPTIALKTDGTLWAVGGRNLYGEFGQNNTISGSSPVQIGSDTDWEDVDASAVAVMAIKTNGTLWGIGINGGRFGNNVTTNVSSPVQIGSATHWRGVTLLNNASIFLYVP